MVGVAPAQGGSFSAFAVICVALLAACPLVSRPDFHLDIDFRLVSIRHLS
jgi:hypothetical protein